MAIKTLDEIAKERGVPFPFISVDDNNGTLIVNDLPHDELAAKVEDGWFDDIDNPYTITLHQIEMWLCEYQKYWKVKYKIGKQRSKFPPSKHKTTLIRDEDIVLTSTI